VSAGEVCVVGAGAGGALAAWALVNRGIRVTLLDAGPRWPPVRFATHDPRFELHPDPLERLSTSPGFDDYEAPPGERLDPAFSALASRRPSAVEPRRIRREPFVYRRAFGLGGSTLHYQGEAHRFPPHSFRMRSERGVGADWPIGYDDLAPYYERVERLLGVAGDARNPFKAPRGPYPYPAHPLSDLSRRMRDAARGLGLDVLPNPVAILPEARPGRAACHYCNGCWRGCAVSARGNVDVAVLPPAEETGRLRVVTGFRVSRLEHGADGRIRAAVGSDADGREQRHVAEAFVLAAGAIQTPRILLNSAGGAHPRGVGNAADQVGRHLMETLYVVRRAIVDAPVESYAGIPWDSRIWNQNGAAGPGDPANGFVLGQGCGSIQGPASHAVLVVEGFGARHREGMRQSFGAGAELFGIAEQLPRESNRVLLSDRRDDAGAPLARVETGLDRDDLRVLEKMHTRLGELAGAARWALVDSQDTAYDRPSATHVGGTCRMGEDPEHSVVDALGAVHGVPNLVIADGSALVSQGAGDSPSLTIQALALRAAEALAERNRRGES
jgi:choline dehydrogenase-like flavoprotein